jgi:hypothetical protein
MSNPTTTTTTTTTTKEPPAPKAPWPPETDTWATYGLHCHCGAIRYTMRLSPPIYADEADGQGVYPVMDCTCSYCARNGYQTVHPLAGNVRFLQGVEDRVEYWTANKVAPLWFCRKCGSALGGDIREVASRMGGEGRFAVNVSVFVFFFFFPSYCMGCEGILMRGICSQVRMLKRYEPDLIVFKKVEFMKDLPPKYDIEVKVDS